MKRALLMLTAIAVIANSVPVIAAEDDSYKVFGDLFISRPLGFVAILLGTAVYAVSLPIALTSGSYRQTGEMLVGRPVEFTFRRPLGEFREEFGFRYDQPLQEPLVGEPLQGGTASEPKVEQGKQPPSQ